MKMNWSSTLKDAIRDVLDRAERDHGILDAYAAATRIQNELPQENVALEDIIAALLCERGAIRVIEFSPPAASVLEVILPGTDGLRHLRGENEDAIVVSA